MEVNIWSDVVCPFCYIGKRHFEQAVRELPFGEKVSVQWRAFELQPDSVSEGLGMRESLVKHKGVSSSQAQAMMDNVAEMASRAGLRYDMTRSIGANTLNAHQASHFMQERGLGDAMAERLFEAAFVKGEDVGDKATLLRLAEEAGLETGQVGELAMALESGAFEYDVRMDEREAQAIGVRGVPFFVFEGKPTGLEGGEQSRDKFAMSGAQPVEMFKQALTKAWSEGGYGAADENKPHAPSLEIISEGDACEIDGKDC